MATLADIVRSRRSSGQSRTGSLFGSLKDKLAEKFDPRQIFNQTGILTSLFPSLKAYKASTDRRGADSTKPSLEQLSVGVQDAGSNLSIIETNTAIAAKNSMFLPILSRDMNIMRQNLSKFVKVMTSQSETKPDSYFKRSDEMEAEFERKFSRIKTKKTGNLKEPEKEKSDGGSGFLSKIATILSSLVSGIVTIVKSVIVSLSAVVKALITTLITAITPLVSAAFKTLISGVTKMLMSIGKALLTAFNLKDLLPKILLSAAGLKAIVAALAVLGAYKIFKKGMKNVEESEEAFTLASRVANGTATPDEIKRLEELKAKYEGLSSLIQAGEANNPNPRAKTSSLKDYVDPETTKFILDNINSPIEKDRIAATVELNNLGVSLETLQQYSNQQSNPKTRGKYGLQKLQNLQNLYQFPEESGAGPNLGRLDKSGQSFTPASAAIENLLFRQPDRDYGPELDSTAMLKSDRVLAATQQNSNAKQNRNEGQTSIYPTTTFHPDGRVTMGNQNKSKIPGVVNVDFPESVQLGSWEFQ
jgi:hypothetical protein